LNTKEVLEDLNENIDFFDYSFENHYNVNNSFYKKFKIKLVITEMLKSNKEKYFRKIISPIISKTSISGDFGLFHT
jgi:hypothetical protein